MTRPIFRILVVEDHAATCTVVKQVLAMRGHPCEIVDDVPAALRAVDTFEPEVVLLEWSRRDGRGLGLASQLRLRSNAQGRSLVIAAWSVLDQPTGFREDVDAYFTKPSSLVVIEEFFCARLLCVA